MVCDAYVEPVQFKFTFRREASSWVGSEVWNGCLPCRSTWELRHFCVNRPTAAATARMPRSSHSYTSSHAWLMFLKVKRRNSCLDAEKMMWFFAIAFLIYVILCVLMIIFCLCERFKSIYVLGVWFDLGLFFFSLSVVFVKIFFQRRISNLLTW